MELKLLALLLNNEFYNNNRHKLSSDLFTDELLELYEALIKGHEKYDHDLSMEELFALWKDANPVATKMQISSMAEVVETVKNVDLDLSEDIASDVLTGLWQRQIGIKIGQLGIAISEGNADAFAKVRKLLDDAENGFMPDDFQPEVSKDLFELLEAMKLEDRWRFNIRALDTAIGGVGGGDFIEVFARPETGKSAFSISLACGPRGFCEQGAKVLILGNEEDPAKHMLRAYSAYTGMTRDEILQHPKGAVEGFKPILDNITMMDIQSWSLAEVEAYIKSKKADIVFIDQFDKVSIPGNNDAPHLKLRELYIQGRELAKRQDIALFAVSQASVEAQGKTYLDPSMMENSKTGKFAEADLIMGIGKYPDQADGTPEPVRFINIGKNKLTGFHGQLTCKLEHQISRYVD